MRSFLAGGNKFVVTFEGDTLDYEMSFEGP